MHPSLALPAALPTATRSRKRVRENRTAVERIGLGIILFILVWLAAGLEVALLGAALIVGFQVVLRAISSEPEDEGR